MRFSWRQVSALFVLVALLAAGCSSDPSELIVQDDRDEVVEETAEDTDVADAAGDAAADSVAGDSAPIPVQPPGPVEPADPELLKEYLARQEQWQAQEIVDYDYAVRLTHDDVNLVHVEVRDNEVTRSFSTSDDLNDGVPTLDELMIELEPVIGTEVTELEYSELGYASTIGGLDDGDPLVLEIFRFREVDVDAPPCSADGLTYPSPEATDPVSTTHAALLEAAQACDYLSLMHLADIGSEPLTTSFGGSGVELLWESEAGGIPVLAIMAELLSTDATVGANGFATWPEAFTDPELEYLDWRIGIDPMGEWLFFVAGD